MKAFYSLFIMFVMLISFHCGKNSSPVSPLPSSPGIIPLRVGNSWIFTQTNFDTSGNEISKGDLSYSITRDTLMSDGRLYFVFREDSLFFDSYYQQYLFTNGWLINDREGLWKAFQNSTLVYAYPTDTSSSSWFNRAGLVGRTPTTNETILVPAGFFTCIKYEFASTMSMRLFDVYVQPNFGEVMSVSYSIYPKVMSTTVLRKYTVN